MTMAVEFSAEIFGCFTAFLFLSEKDVVRWWVDTHTMYKSLLSLQQLSQFSSFILFRSQRRAKLRDGKKKKERLRDADEDDWEVYVFNKEKRGQAQEDAMLIETLSAFHQLPPGTHPFILATVPFPDSTLHTLNFRSSNNKNSWREEEAYSPSAQTR